VASGKALDNLWIDKCLHFAKIGLGNIESGVMIPPQRMIARNLDWVGTENRSRSWIPGKRPFVFF